jgi:PiT family inorganic phosphate transporter
VTVNLWLLVVAALAVTLANGANDNFKGVATLFGSGTTSYRRALLWATVTTMAGSVMALALAGSLVTRFSGRGLVPDVLTGDPGFLTCVACGAALTVLFATIFASRFGLPVSTTHVSTGSLFGLGAVTGGAQWRTMAQILLAWVVTLPCAAVCSGLLWWLVR